MLEKISKEDDKWIVVFTYLPFLEEKQTLTVEIDSESGKVVGYKKE